LKLKLLDILGDRGMNEGELRRTLLDYHDVIEMRPRRVL
jgi:predicted RNA-binding protein